MSDAKGLLQELAIEMIREIRLHGSLRRPRFPRYSRFPVQHQVLFILTSQLFSKNFLIISHHLL